MMADFQPLDEDEMTRLNDNERINVIFRPRPSPAQSATTSSSPKPTRSAPSPDHPYRGGGDENAPHVSAERRDGDNVDAQRRLGPREKMRKSRRGCRNCKRRKVKCGEELPQCRMCERFGFGCEYPVEPTLLTLDHSGTLIKQPTEERRQSIGIDDVHRKSQIMPATTHTRKDQAHKRGMAYPGGRRHHPDCKPEFWLEAEIDFQESEFNVQRTELSRKGLETKDHALHTKAYHAPRKFPSPEPPDSDLDLGTDSDSEPGLPDQIQDHGLPAMAARLLKSSSKVRNSDPDAERISCELAYSQPLALRVHTSKPDLWDDLKLEIEKLSGVSWDWWPLEPPKRRILPKQVRLSWQCRCGRSRSEIVSDRFGKMLRRVFANAAAAGVVTKPTDSSHGSVQTGREAGERQGDAPGPNRRPKKSRQQGWSPFHRESDPDGDGDEKSDPLAMDPEGAVLPAVIPRAIYFMVDNASMFPWNSRLEKSVIPTRDLCDERFYHNMRWEFWRRRGWLKSLFSLETFAGCDFYQFERYGRDKYHETAEGVPDVGDEYLYLRRKLKPQVSREEFRDGYWDWHNSRCPTLSQCPSSSVVTRIPKRRHDESPEEKQSPPPPPPDVIWGIIARTQRAFYMAAIYIMVATSPLVPATWFFFKWLAPGEGLDEYQLANHRDNLSNAFVPLGIAIALLLATITCVFSKFE